jgi:glycosyltransferase involved in cell wall biosynthesis
MYLARSLYGDIPGGVVGMGFDMPSDSEAAQLEPYFSEPSPYILYLGRKEMGKNVHVLIDYFCKAKDLGAIDKDVRLVVLGGGSFEDLYRSETLQRGDVIDLPHLSERDKQRVVKHALYLCQPSLNESFSIVLMEAWMMKAPVVVHGECAVTKHHVVESAGGLYFSSMEDLVGVTRFMLENPMERGDLARRGAQYVAQQFSWEAALHRFDHVMTQMSNFEGQSVHQADAR